MQTETMKVSGMTCGGCTGKVSRALKAIPGVGDATVSLSAGEVTVQYDEGVTSPDRLKSAVEAAGYDVNETKAALAEKSKGCCCG